MNERIAPTTAERPRQLLRPVLAWLLDDPTASPRVRRGLDALVFAAFVVLVCVGSAGHDVWRDEARALTLALEPDSWLGLPAALRNEGHPALWHLLLRLGHALVGSSLVLPLVAGIVGVAAAALAYFAAPLPTWWRVAFLFGWVPLFGASIVRRNYGIAMLLLFAFCWLVVRVRPRPLLAGAALALLANTNVYGTMMAGCFALVLVVEARRRGCAVARIVLAVLLVAAGIALSAYTLLPTPESKLLPSATGVTRDLAAGIVDGVASFPSTAGPLFGIAALAWPIVLITAAATLALPHVTVAVLVFFTAASWFVARVYSAGPLQLAMPFVVLVAATWLRAAAGAPAAAPPRTAARLHAVAWSVLLYAVWPALLVLHAHRGLRAVRDEILHVNTAAPELAALLDRPELRGAVLVGEPDYFLDALPAYRDNAIWAWREGRFVRRVSWTTANRSVGDLDGLLATARALQRDGAPPVLLVVGKEIRLDHPDGDVVHGYATRFVWTAEQQRAFAAATELVASLPAQPEHMRGDEHYVVYRLRAP